MINKGKVVNIVLSGGSGTRLWPLSRTSKPKQFLKIFNELSLFQHTVKRNNDLVDEFLLVTNESQLLEGNKQMSELGYEITNKIVEPVGRNTAPAIALAAFCLAPDDIMIVTPSDHMIKEIDLYSKSIKRGIELAKENFLVTFGIEPKFPNTGFGYIEFDGEEVLSFREKPDLKTAEYFLEQGNFNWNSGIFCFKASTFLNELKKYNKEIFETSFEAFKQNNQGVIKKQLMLNIPSDSIDYAVLEKSDKIKTISSNFYWTDLGTFDAIIDYFDEGNEVIDLHRLDDLNSYSFTKKKVFTNVDNLIIVDTEDSIVVLEKNESNHIKEIYNKVKKELPNLIE